MRTRNSYYESRSGFINFIDEHGFKDESNLLVQIFSSELDKNVLTEILETIKELLPQAKIIGATTDGEILEDKVTTNKVVVSISAFQKATLGVAIVEKSEDSFSCGQELVKKIISDDTKAMILFADGLNTNGELFLNGVRSVANDITIAGGMASDNGSYGTTYVISSDGIISSGAVGVSINTDKLHVNTFYSLNWQEIGRPLVVTKAENNRVYEIEDTNIIDIYSRYLGEDVAKSLPASGTEFPLIVDRDGFKIARTVIGKNSDGSLTFAGNIHVGDKVHFGYGNSDMILNDSVKTRDEFISRPVESLFIYSCMARRRFLGGAVSKEITPISSIAPTSGFFTYGEFYKNDNYELLNETMTIISLSESDEVVSYHEDDAVPFDSTFIESGATQKALSHLIKQTSKELKESNENLERMVELKTKELQDKIEELENASKVKSDFLANMSHEVRTPLNAILGFVDILKADERDKEKQKRFSIIKNAGATLLTVINDILDFSKIESGKMILERRKFATKKPFKEIGLLFFERAKEEGINLKFHFNRELPRFFVGDIVRIKQVVSNLLSNAIKFTPKGGEINMHVEFNVDEKLLKVRVKDSGIGIEKNNLDKIFESFAQEDSSTTRKFGGTGLGLSISNALINSMQGNISVSSEVGVGSEFSFTLPVLEAESVEDSKDSPGEKIDYEKQIDADILLVEDNKTNQMFMNIILGEIGLRVDLAENGLEAVEKFKEKRYDLILMDENMPKMSGIEATKVILDMEEEKGLEHTPIIALTANALATDREKFLNAGMDEFVSKPVDTKEFIKILHGFLLSE